MTPVIKSYLIDVRQEFPFTQRTETRKLSVVFKLSRVSRKWSVIVESREGCDAPFKWTRLFKVECSDVREVVKRIIARMTTLDFLYNYGLGAVQHAFYLATSFSLFVEKHSNETVDPASINWAPRGTHVSDHRRFYVGPSIDSDHLDFRFYKADNRKHAAITAGCRTWKSDTVRGALDKMHEHYAANDTYARLTAKGRGMYTYWQRLLFCRMIEAECRRRGWVDGYALVVASTPDNGTVSDSAEAQKPLAVEPQNYYEDTAGNMVYIHSNLHEVMRDNLGRSKISKYPFIGTVMVSKTGTVRTGYWNADGQSSGNGCAEVRPLVREVEAPPETREIYQQIYPQNDLNTRMSLSLPSIHVAPTPPYLRIKQVQGEKGVWETVDMELIKDD